VVTGVFISRISDFLDKGTNMNETEQNFIIKAIEYLLSMEPSARSHNKLWQKLKRLCKEKGYTLRKKYILKASIAENKSDYLKDALKAFEQPVSKKSEIVDRSKGDEDYYRAMGGF
jgi:isopenicillin N synthase-like dioxygenase